MINFRAEENAKKKTKMNKYERINECVKFDLNIAEWKLKWVSVL